MDVNQGIVKNTVEFELARFIIEKTSNNLLVVGKAGTGKTTFLNSVVANTNKRVVVLAPSGIAAIEAHGSTIHSFFRFNTLPYIPDTLESKKDLSASNLAAIKNIETIIIDEISMVRADLMDRIDHRLRSVRENKKPFGGVQVVMIGDLRQLPPVVEEGEDEKLIDTYYDSPYFFDSKVMKRTEFLYLEFSKVYRQSNLKFVDLLNRVRDNKVTDADIILINSKFKRKAWEKADKDSISLVTHNYQADQLNWAKMKDLPSNGFHYKATYDNWYEDNPAPYNLFLKKGAHVMFVKNRGEQFSNGTLGVVTSLGEDFICVRIKGTEQVVNVEPVTWIAYDYIFNVKTEKIEIRDRGYYHQYPLIPAWAITVHKSQGQTFDKVLLNISKCFADGQAYVALSRCRNFDGLTMVSKISKEQIKTDTAVDKFLKKMQSEYSAEAIAKKVGFELKAKSEERAIKPKSPSNKKLSPTILETYKLAKQGLSLAEIIKARGLAESTLIGHIAECISAGLLDCNSYVSSETQSRIQKVLNEHPEGITKKEIFETLGDVTYPEIILTLSKKD